MKPVIILTSIVANVAVQVAKQINVCGFKNLVFITTASEAESGDKAWLKEDRDALLKIGFKVKDYTLTDKAQAQLKKDLKEFDAYCLAGGNTFYLLAKIKQSGFDKVIKNELSKEKLYIGSSAGSIVAGPNIYPIYSIDDPSKAPELKDYNGLGLVDYVVMPHWGSKDFKKAYLKSKLKEAYSEKYKIILLTDNQYIMQKQNSLQIIDIKKS